MWPRGDWRYWLLLAGRGFGKTRVGAENIVDLAVEHPGCRIAVVGPTLGDTRDVCFEGDSGILACLPDECRSGYNRSLLELTLPNETYIKGFGAEKPDRLRGPQHWFAWCDELASWAYADDVLDNLKFGLRLGPDPRVIITTTPRPKKIIRELVADPNTFVTRGTTYENRANVAPAFLDTILKKYEGTRVGRQELHAEILDEVPGALWQRSMIEKCRIRQPPELARIVVGIDPAVTSKEDSDETGIVVCGRDYNNHGYVLADISQRSSPETWARNAIDAFKTWQADRIVAEVNKGGYELIQGILRVVNPLIPYHGVRATRGKATRAEPIASLYEQGRVHHVGPFDALEDQMCMFTPDNAAGNSPDRVDALVWAFTELFGDLMMFPEFSHDRHVLR